MAIEQIRTGELVLTQNVQSGQLEFKPVVRPTTRPTMALVNLTIGQDEFTCTGGHLFWVVEQGWVKARDLKPGMVVHGAQRSATVVSNEPGPTSPTFNLVMADNHNYFVGESRLLTHDNTPRQATSLVAPGVSAEEE
jgi:intein/homing endonuclease